MKQHIVIHWFRQDLRLADNPALIAAIAAAAAAGKSGKDDKDGGVLPIYILDDTNAGDYAMGAASRVWLHHALQSLQRSTGGALSLYCGEPLAVLHDLCKRYDCRQVYWNRCYEPWRIARDTRLKQQLQQQGITAHTFNSALLWEPWQVKKADGSAYQVFTPFYHKGCAAAPPPRLPLAAPPARVIKSRFCADEKNRVTLPALSLLPTSPRWDIPLQAHWTISEAAAHKLLAQFLQTVLSRYKDGRDFPAKMQVSRLSPYLHFGQLSPHQVWHAARQQEQEDNSAHFCRELGWREFSYHLLFHHPTLPAENMREKFNTFPWRGGAAARRDLAAWQTGRSGIPIIDAGMRELWQTGYMHNRVRMLVGSFLVKNLRLHWKHGERWFWDCLVDADLANNSAGWQWVAGSGADGAPYFRIFNASVQAQKFDPQGEYIRRYVPELRQLPPPHLFAPQQAPPEVLAAAGITLGKQYPYPIVDLKESRQAALNAFRELREQGPGGSFKKA